MSLWGGRFTPGAGGADARFKALNDSLPFDADLVLEDLRGSACWARALRGAGVLSVEQCAALEAALAALAQEAQRPGAREAILASGAEDVHSWVEARLIERTGDLGKKLHTGRSRNDQVATDLRLFAAEFIRRARAALRDAAAALLTLAERTTGVVVPGYTHLQRGQPVLLAHWALAYVEMLARDDGRLADADARVRVSPLGCGALAGTAYPIDRAALAQDLGFREPARNSLDAVSDRDFVLELLAACVLTMAHLSRLGEDLVIYSSSEFAFVAMDDAVTSGSSLMPQKKNPDAAELLRGKMGRVLGAFVALATTLKGLPLAYNKDLQEDKEGFFDACRTTLLALSVVPAVIASLRVDEAACRRAALGDGTILATELADYLVGQGVPFRDAHHAAGRAVRMTLESGTPLHELPLERLRIIDPRIGPDVHASLTLEASLARRDALGGTSPRRVAEAIAAARAAWSA